MYKHNKVPNSKQLCLTYDETAPTHCSEKSACNEDAMNVSPRVRKEGIVNFTLVGWTDNVSGIKDFSIDVYEVSDATHDLIINYANQSNSLTNITSVSGTFELPWQPALYAVVVSGHDIAGNTRVTRRYILYDTTSNLQLSQQHPMRIISGRSDMNFKWQNHLQYLQLNWTNRFYNTYHISNNRLKPIRPDGHGRLPCPYEQCSGELPVGGTKNVHGIVAFLYQVTRGESAPIQSSYMNIDDFENQTIKFNHTVLNDGYRYTIWMIARDIMNNTNADNVSVMIDSTKSEIAELGLVNNGIGLLKVHRERDLSKMKIHFHSWDIHSGLEHIIWTLGTAPDGNDVGEGSLSIPRWVSDSCSVI